MTASEVAETWYRLELSTHQSVCFVLDASDIGLKHQNAALQLLAHLRNQLPRFNQNTLAFLGSDSRFEAKKLTADGASLFLTNQRRLSTIAPVYESAGHDVRFVILAASPIFDVQDWQDTPQFNRSVFVNLGNESLTNGLTPELPPDVSRIAERLESVLSSVRIAAAGGLPLSWDNPAYQLQTGMELQARNADQYSVTFAIAGPLSEVNAECLFTNGERQMVSPTHIDRLTIGGAWGSLPDEREVTIAQECISNRQYSCPHCKKIHRRSELSCIIQGQFLPTSVFASIANVPGNVFALLRQSDSGQVTCCSISNPLVPLNATQVAVFQDGRVRVMNYDGEQKRWCDSDTGFEQFCFLERLGAYAICLR